MVFKYVLSVCFDNCGTQPLQAWNSKSCKAVGNCKLQSTVHVNNTYINNLPFTSISGKNVFEHAQINRQNNFTEILHFNKQIVQDSKKYDIIIFHEAKKEGNIIKRFEQESH